MRACLFIAVLLAVQVQSSANKQNGKTDQHEAVGNNKSKPSSAPIPNIYAEIKQQGSNGVQEPSIGQRMIEGFTANWPLVVVGLLGVWAAMRTLDTIREQTRHLRTAADAAKASADTALLNVEAIVNAERALVEIDLMEPGTDIDEKTGEMSIDYAKESKYGIKITNHGRTAARVISYTVWHGCFEKNFDKNGFPNYGSWQRHMLLGTSEWRRIGDFDLWEMFNDWDSIRDDKMRAMLRIDVQYEDIIQRKPHETSAVFYYSVEAEEPKRLPQYNSYT